MEQGSGGAKIFLSYGQRDAAPLAGRIRHSLIEQGFDVFQDAERLHAGAAWSEEIRAGIRSSVVLVAVLSPHAVRRAGLPGNPDNKDSVCLDEIAYAVDECQIPVIPVMAATCEPPFRIFRLQYLDFRQWEQSEAHLTSLLEQLRREVERACMTGRSRVREWGWLPEPLRFDAFLAERRSGFVGRTWMLSNIEQWRLYGTRPALLMTGGPGTGKSAIVSEIVHTNPGGQVVAYHCCQADTPATLEPARFVRSVAGMLTARLEGYAALLENHDLRQALSEGETLKDPSSAFEAGVLNALRELPTPAEPRYLLIDALDEALTTTSAATIVDLLATRLRRFPKWLKIVATTRPEPAVLSRLKGVQAFALDVHDPRNVEDIADYLRQRFDEPSLAARIAAVAKSPEDAKTLLLNASKGTFLIARQIVDAIEHGELDLDRVEQLPPGLGSLYHDFFDRLYRRSGTDFAPARTVLQTITSALAPLTRSDLAQLTGLGEESDLPLILRRLASFLPQYEGRYRVFHKSLFDWLTGWDTSTDQPQANEYYVSLTEGHERWVSFLWPQYDGRPHSLPDPVISRLPRHLVGAERWDALAAVLLDWRFLEAKASGAVGVYGLAADFALAAERMPAAHPEARRLSRVSEILRLDAPFLAQHPQTLFQCCWNRGWWHDSPHAAHFYTEPQEGWPVPGPPWARTGHKVSAFMEQWHAGKILLDPDFLWLRSLRPAAEQLGAAHRAVLHGHRDGIKAIDVSLDGLRLVSADDALNVTLWDALTGAVLVSKELPDDIGALFGVAFVPGSGAVVAATDDGCLLYLDESTLEETHRVRVTNSFVSSMTVTADGSLAALGDDEGRIYLCNLRTPTHVSSVSGYDGEVECLAFSPQGRRLASYGMSGPDSEPRVRVWAVGDEIEPMTEFETPTVVQCLCFLPDGNSLMLGDYYEGRIACRNLSTGAEWSVAVTPGTPIAAISALPDGKRVLVGAGAFGLTGRPAPVVLYNLQTRCIEHTFHGHVFSVADLALFPGARGFASAGDSTIHIWDLTRCADEIELMPSEYEVTGIAFNHDGVAYTCCDKSPTALARSLKDGNIVAAFSAHQGSVGGIALSIDGRWLACGTDVGELSIWSTETRALVRSKKLSEHGVRALTFSDDGALVVTADGSGTIFVVEVHDPGRRLDITADSTFPVHHAAFSADRQLLATAAWGAFHVWDLEMGNHVATLRTPGTMYDSYICFVPGSEELVLQEVGALTAWNARTGEAVPFRAEHRAAFERATNRSPREFEWEGDDHPSGVPPLPNPLTLLHSHTRRPVAFLPIMRGEMSWHRSGRIWANRRAHLLSVFTLEGQFKA